jgi:DNA topoisomerase-1
MFTLTLAEAKEMFAQPKTRGRGARAAAPPLRELGEDPATGKPMVIKDGRFGPYVTDGETNASLRKGDDVASISVQRAAELLADRRAAPPAPRRRSTATGATRASTSRKKAGTTARSASKRSLSARTKE